VDIHTGAKKLLENMTFVKTMQKNLGTITECFAIANNVSGTKQVGGLVGENRGTIENTYATANVSNRDAVDDERYAGGLVGNNYDGSISFSYATGTVSDGTSGGGGLVGNNGGLYAQINNSVAINPKIINNNNNSDYLGRVAGRNSYQSRLNNNYARDNMSLNDDAQIDSENTYNQKNGAPINDSRWENDEWWRRENENGPGYSNNVWEFHANTRLPTLKNMPGNYTQDPQIKQIP
jgi:hypothetical protein